MNEELAQELSEAGFEKVVSVWLSPNGKVMSSKEVEGYRLYYIMPTLSELIEACGTEFKFLERYEGEWKAVGGEWKPGYGDDYPTYSTPEEAVAHLWLALNKPND